MVCAQMAMRIIIDLTYYESVSQVNWLLKLDLFKVLTEQCDNMLMATSSYVKIFSNLMLLNNPLLQSARLDFLLKICQANVSSLITNNFIKSSGQVELVCEGVIFLSSFVAQLARLTHSNH